MRALLFAAALMAAPAAFAEPQTYTLDPQHAQAAFSIDRFGFNHVIGRFDGMLDANGRLVTDQDVQTQTNPPPARTPVISGELVLDEAAPEHSSVHAIIRTAGLTTGNPVRDMHLKGENWLKTAQFPTMEYRSTGVHQTDATHATVTGDLTLVGQTHPVTLSVTLNHIGEHPSRPNTRLAGFTATGVIHRTQFGLAAALSTPERAMIGDDVNITIEALAMRPMTSATPPPR